MRNDGRKAQMRLMVQEMREICDAMEAMMAMPEPAMRPERTASSDSPKTARTRTRKHRGVQVGDRVRIMVKGDCYGRLGVVTGARGSMFWWILLDETETMAARRVYKMQTSFKVVERN